MRKNHTNSTLSLEGKKTDENLITIIIYCSTCRIQIQGRSMLAWGDNEFLTIKKLVDIDIDEISPNTTSKNLQTFIENIRQTPTKETRPDEVNEMSSQGLHILLETRTLHVKNL